MMESYISATTCISPQNTMDEKWFFENSNLPVQNFLHAMEPPYDQYISPNQIRRMSKAIKMGVTAAMKCLKDANQENVNGIIVGTAMGCFEDSLRFLESMIENKEELLAPTAFIQSTHNTVASSIAMILNCHEYNFTYVHRGFSFESALTDAMMQIREDERKKILAGSIDENPSGYLKLMEGAGYLKKEIEKNNFVQSNTEGAVCGEGSAFFLMSGLKTETSIAILKDVKTIYKPVSNEEVVVAVNEFLSANELQLPDIDIVMMGFCGDSRYDGKMKYVSENIFKNNLQLTFKNLCGEYPTAVSFALWIATAIIRKQEVPEVLRINSIVKSQYKNILIFNQYRDMNYSLILLRAC